MSTIKIAIVAPRTGPLHDLGTQLISGAEQAIKAINDKNGVNGKKLEAVFYDDAGDPKQAVAVANKVVNDGVSFVIGHLVSSAALPASDIYEDENMILVSPGATSPEVTCRGYRLLFRTIGHDAVQGEAAVNWIVDRAKAKVVAVIHDGQMYGEGLAIHVRCSLQKRGVKVAFAASVRPDDKDFSKTVDELSKAKADLVYFGGYHPALSALMRQAKQAGLRTRFMASECVPNEAFRARTGEATEGLLVTAPPHSYDAPTDNERVKAIHQAAKGAYVLPSYAAVEAIVQGIAAAGSEETDQVARAMHHGRFDTVMGSLQFQENGDVKEGRFEVFEFHHGKPPTLRE